LKQENPAETASQRTYAAVGHGGVHESTLCGWERAAVTRRIRWSLLTERAVVKEDTIAARFAGI
jgi:hypothetical protein